MKYNHSTLRSIRVNETIVETAESEAENENQEAAITLAKINNEPNLKRNTPILFSTNRGLHLRIASNTSIQEETLAATSSQANSKPSVINSTYNIAFCDLERWSKNRANTISLEDTFTIPKPSVVPSSAVSGSLASTSLQMFPKKSASVRFNGYTRFDVQ